MFPYIQINRLMSVTTPLGPDVVLLSGLEGREAISTLFCFQLDLLVPLPMQIAFEKLLGQDVGVRLALPGTEKRFFHGMINQLVEQRQDDTFTHYQAHLVPKPWLLQRRFRSRTFQQMSVPEILKEVLHGFDFSLALTDEYPRRDFTVQYGETDHAFLCRLMEEEGIGYYFRFEKDRHEMIFFDNSMQLSDLPHDATVIYDEVTDGVRDGVHITRWEKRQRICCSDVKLWDHSFQLPDQNLEGTQSVTTSMKLGQIEHTLPGTDEKLEHYEYPGGYARWFDGVDPGGTPRPNDPAKTFEQNTRVAKVRMQEQAARAFELTGEGNCLQFAPGHKFTLLRHRHANGKYLMCDVEHSAHLSAGFRSDPAMATLDYTNTFSCLPDQLMFRPARVTPRPIIHGVQTATVVGPADNESFVDQYGRIKVQFHWDRDGKENADSSCWIRVAQIWAGPKWGAFFWPRVGHEVVVAFVEGDPDQPLVVGSVYNAKNMPPVELPAEKTIAGIKSKIFGGDQSSKFNAFYIHDTPGAEYIQMHSEAHEVQNCETNRFKIVPQGEFAFHGHLFP